MPITENSDDVVALLKRGDKVETDDGPGVVQDISLHGAAYNGEWQLEPPSVAVKLDSGKTIHTCLCSLKLKNPKHTKLLHREFERLWPPMTEGVPENADALIPEGDEDEAMRQADVRQFALKYLRANPDIAIWDSRTLDHLNYTDAYEGEFDTIDYMVEKLADADLASAEQFAAEMHLEGIEPYGADEDVLDVWEEIIELLAAAGLRTWYSTKLPGGSYELGVLNGEFGFVFHADTEDTDKLRDELHGYDRDEEFDEEY